MNLYNIIAIIVVIAFIVLSLWVTGGQFYYSVIAISTIVLIVGIVYVGLMIRNARQNLSWAPVVGQCPDNWTFNPSGNKCVVPKGEGDYNKPDQTNSNCVLSGDDYIIPFTDAKYLENRKTWAKNCKVYWDGVTNV